MCIRDRIYTVQGAVDNLLPKVLSQLYSTYPQLHVTAEAASITDIYAHAQSLSLIHICKGTKAMIRGTTLIS